MRRTQFLWLALVIPFAFTLSAVAAPGPKTETKPETSPAEAIRKALERTGKFEFSDVNLAGILKTLSEEYKINIVLDRGVIQGMGLEPEIMNVELKMKEGKLRSALRAMVGQYNLTYVIVGDSLLVTTEEMAVYRQLKQRINVDYDAVPFNKAIKELAAKYSVSVVIDPKVTKTKTVENPVTITVDDVPFEAAVRLMCEMAELKPARMGNVIYVTTEARSDRLKDGDSLVPTPRLGMPGMEIPIGGIGGLGGGAIPPMVVIPPPAALPAVPDKKEEKKDELPKKDG
jgi:hypothetical protein